MDNQMTEGAIEIRGKMIDRWITAGESIAQIEAWADDPICQTLINLTAQAQADKIRHTQKAER